MSENNTPVRETVPDGTEIADEAFPFPVPDDVPPEEIFEVMDDRGTLLVPRLQSMKSYIAFHYKRTLCRYLERYLAAKVRESGTEVPYAAEVKELKLGRMEFRSLGRYTLIAGVDLEAAIDFGMRRGIRRRYAATVEFETADGIRLRGVVIAPGGTDVNAGDCAGGCPLDEYLIPVMNKARIEERAEELLKAYCPEALADQHLNLPLVLAGRMGLNVTQLPLHRRKKTRSLLFFKKGKITVDAGPPDENGETGKTEVTVPGNTVVINTNAVRRDRCMLEIFHECVHYEWHYLFFLLQDLYEDDLNQIRKTRDVRRKRRKKADALSWLEFQAVHGSFAVWMPAAFMKKELEQRRTRLSGLHPGAQYEQICMGIAGEYGIPPYRVRARLVRMGNVEARGACNYLDGRFLQPFSFRRDQGSGDHTFVISREQFAKNYFQDPAFRKLIDSRRFIYLDGHVCLNAPGVCRQTAHGPEPAAEVLRQIDRYCLRFVEVYERDESYVFRFGRLHSDEEYNRHFLYFPPKEYPAGTPRPDEVAQEQINMRYLRKLPRYFPDLLVRLMADCRVSVEELAWRTGMSTRTVNRLRNEPRAAYSADQIVAVIVGLHLPPWVSDHVLKAASVSFSDNPVAYNYSYVVSCMFMDPFETVREHLARMGLKTLCLNDPE